MERICIYFFMLISISSFAQNLVPNGDFEQYDTCPDQLGQINYAIGWSAYEGTPDYYNACAPSSGLGVPTNVVGYQPAHSGNGYAGFIAYDVGVFHPSREYLGRALSDTLIVGKKYYLSLFVSYTVTEGVTVACNKMGALLSTIPYSTAVPYFNFEQVYAPNVITDSVSWTQIKGSFIADSAYRYIMIGNFFDDAHTDTSQSSPQPNLEAYYYLDDVCLSTDSNLCNFAEGILSVAKEDSSIELFPNPASGLLYIQLRDDKLKVNSLRIINTLGQVVYDIRDSNSLKEKITINTLQLSNGIYHIIINTDSFQVTKSIIISNF